jgi:CHAT domain-containing protein
VREQLDNKFVGTELLVLSACNTAMSSGENSSGAEIEGFGALAQLQGAKSVLASLWSVADASTMELMTDFYGNLENNPNIGKAEALRTAQMKMIRGEYKTPEEMNAKRSKLIGVNGETSNQPAFNTDDKAPFAHPYYWSPFILIGNWR